MSAGSAVVVRVALQPARQLLEAASRGGFSRLGLAWRCWLRLRATFASAFACGFCFAFFGSSLVTGRVPILALSSCWLALSWLVALRRPAPLRWARGLLRSLGLTWLLRRPALLLWARGLWRSLALTWLLLRPAFLRSARGRWARGIWRRSLALTLRWAESLPLLRWGQTL